MPTNLRGTVNSAFIHVCDWCEWRKRPRPCRSCDLIRRDLFFDGGRRDAHDAGRPQFVRQQPHRGRRPANRQSLVLSGLTARLWLTARL